MKNDEMAIPIPVRIYFFLEARRFARATVLSVVSSHFYLPSNCPMACRTASVGGVEHLASNHAVFEEDHAVCVRGGRAHRA